MPGEWFEWEWDETLFAGAAAYYDKGRLPNAPRLAEAFEKALGLDGRGRLLDIGCGPGMVTLPLSGLFEEVVGLDADAGMLAEAKRLASGRGVTNARWIHSRAEDLSPALGEFRVVTFAASFHWLDRSLVAGTVREMLEPDGVVVHVDNRHQDRLSLVDGLPAPPVAEIDKLRRRYLGEDRRAGQSIRNSSPSDEAAVFRAAGFTGPEVVVVPDGRTIVRSADDLVAHTFSNSSTAPHLFGDRLSEFEACAKYWRRPRLTALSRSAFPTTSSKSGESPGRRRRSRRVAPSPRSRVGEPKHPTSLTSRPPHLGSSRKTLRYC